MRRATEDRKDYIQKNRMYRDFWKLTMRAQTPSRSTATIYIPVRLFLRWLHLPVPWKTVSCFGYTRMDGQNMFTMFSNPKYGSIDCRKRRSHLLCVHQLSCCLSANNLSASDIPVSTDDPLASCKPFAHLHTYSLLSLVASAPSLSD